MLSEVTLLGNMATKTSIINSCQCKLRVVSLSPSAPCLTCKKNEREKCPREIAKEGLLVVC